MRLLLTRPRSRYFPSPVRKTAQGRALRIGGAAVAVENRKDKTGAGGWRSVGVEEVEKNLKLT